MSEESDYLESKMLVEKKVRFSESMLWDLQKQYFSEEGVDAWAGGVPFYITSNLYIAHSYAQVIIRFIQDYVHQGKVVKSKPFYIFELGTGSGRFSYYLMKQLFELQENLRLTDVKICYVMTDFTESNLKFWKTHPSLKPYLEDGRLDFAIYDLENQETIELVKSKIVFDGKEENNPLVVLGNYIFDTVSQDVFRVEKGDILEAKTSLVADKDNVVNGRPKKLENLDMLCTYFHMASGYYKDEYLNQMLKNYKKTVNEGTFLMPVGGFSCLRNFFNMSNNKLLLISTDKAYSRLGEIEGRSDPSLVCHGSFSMTVNFHAIGEYFKLRGGSVKHQAIRESIKTSVFLLGDDFDELPETSEAIKFFVDTCGPGDFFLYHRQIVENKEVTHLRTILGHLHVSKWDPHFFRLLIDRIVELVKSAEREEIDGLLQGLDTLIDNIYLMPGAHDTYFDAGLLCHALDRIDLAIGYYEQSRKYFGDNFSLLYNLGLCHHAQENKEKAREFFEEAKKMNPSSEDVDQWLTRLNED